jgi:hypothetical protein
LFYEEIVAMSFDDLDAMEQWGWARACGEQSYPIAGAGELSLAQCAQFAKQVGAR